MNDTAPLTLTFTDNGNGMVPETMYKMLRYVILCTLILSAMCFKTKKVV